MGRLSGRIEEWHGGECYTAYLSPSFLSNRLLATYSSSYELFNNHALTEALTNYGLKRGVEILKKHGWLDYDSGHNTKPVRINGKQERFYCIKTTD